MNNQQFLDKLKIIADEAEVEKANLRKKGDLFNIFSVLSIQRRENFHSSFIASLLNPQGVHGMGGLFLEAFVGQYPDMIPIDIKSATVVTEYHISKITKDKKRGGRIDILIKDAHRHAIIIENKIDAKDQPAQLIRYNNFAKDNNLEHKIIYLTLDFHEASPESGGKNDDVDYVMYSYKDDIIPWLEGCLPRVPQNSQLRFSIIQYIDNIKTIYNIMDGKDLDELTALAAKPKYEKAVLTLLANQSVFFEQIRLRFIEHLKISAEKLGFNVEVQNDFGKKKDTYLIFTKPHIIRSWGIFIYSEKGNWRDMTYEFTFFEDEKNKLLKKDIKSFPHLWNNYKQTKDMPIGWSYFFSKTGQKASGRWYNWDELEAVTAMANDEMEDFIVEQVLKPVLENKIFNKVKKLTET